MGFSVYMFVSIFNAFFSGIYVYSARQIIYFAFHLCVHCSYHIFNIFFYSRFVGSNGCHSKYRTFLIKFPSAKKVNCDYGQQFSDGNIYFLKSVLFSLIKTVFFVCFNQINTKQKYGYYGMS